MFNIKFVVQRTPVAIIYLLAILALLTISTLAQAEKLKHISLDPNGVSTINAFHPFISTNGRFVVFEGSGLLPADTVNNQVYLFDRELNQLELISVNGNGEPANQATSLPLFTNAKAVSEDGQYVVFRTAADNLGTTTDGIWLHVYVRDRVNHTTFLISKNDAGELENRGSTDFSMAPDGWAVVFKSTSDNLDSVNDGDFLINLFLHELSHATTKLACINKDGDKINQCNEPALSCDGIITFESSDAKAAEDDLHIGWDVFFGNALAGNNETVSRSFSHPVANSNDFRAPNVSCNPSNALSRFVYVTTATLSSLDDDVSLGLDLYYYDVTIGEARMLRAENNVSFRPGSVSMSPNGQWIAFSTSVSLVPEDTNGFSDVYAFRFSRDRSFMSDVRLVSQHDGVVGSGPSDWPAIADNGVVTFQSTANNFRSSTDPATGRLDIYVNGYEEVHLDGFEDPQ